ncbi:MAG: hypothetical protein V7638_3825 [Acidobacteriota bacterium]|jgi:hypothetical protein
MAFVLDATEGGATANSFCTVEFANDLLAGELYASDWPATDAGADLLTKQKALVTATRELNRLEWEGQRTDWNVQALQFPRVNLEDRDGNFVDPNTNPLELKEATVRLALYRLPRNPAVLVDESLLQFKRLKIAGAIELEMREGVPSEQDIPEQVWDLISRWLIIAGSGSVRVYRA